MRWVMWTLEKHWNRVSLKLFGLSRRQLRWINASIRAELVRAANEKAAQMQRADRAEQKAATARHDLDSACQKIAGLEHRVEVQSRALDTAAARFDVMKAARDEAEAAAKLQAGLNGDLARAVEAANAQVAELRKLISNARNQLDGRAHHPDEPVFLPTYTPEVLM